MEFEQEQDEELDQYYYSDEEVTVAWGPLTLREIRKDLTQKFIRPPSRRNSDFGNFTTAPKELLRVEDNHETHVQSETDCTYVTVEGYTVDTDNSSKYFTAEGGDESVLCDNIRPSDVISISSDDGEISFKCENVTTSHIIPSDTDESACLNETLEEMMLFSKYGPDYKYPGESDSDAEREPETFEEIPRVIVEQQPILVPNPVMGRLQSSPAFKQPIAVSKPKTKPLTADKFNDIVSPVRVYIKNGPTCVKRNRGNKMRVMEDGNGCSNRLQTASSEQGDGKFSPAFYQPAKKTVTLPTTAKQVKLGAGIKKFVTEPIITTHVKRTTPNLSESAIERKLQRIPGNIDDGASILDESAAITNVSISRVDVSYHLSRQGFNK